MLISASKSGGSDVKVVQLAALLLAALILFSTDRSLPWRRLSLRARMAFLNATGIGFLFYKVLLTLTHPREWDFLAYYLWSRMRVRICPFIHRSQVKRFSGLQLPINTTEDFLNVVVLVGPNQNTCGTSLYWAVADRSFETAHADWMVVNIGFLGVCCFLLAPLGKTRRQRAPLVPCHRIAPVTGTIIFLN